jgi:hypothetical protein
MNSLFSHAKKNQAFLELAKGERAATALENQLNSMEAKIEALLAQAEAQQQSRQAQAPAQQQSDPQQQSE